MDTTLISAIIGALATIIAALAAALIGLRANASSKREQLETLADAAIVIIARRVVTAEEPEERAFLEENLERLREVRAPTASRLKQAEITVSPGEQDLAFVVQMDNPRPAFNVLTRLTNSG